ncbi:hypothetical protein C8R44DRAFT_979915 [Mycena epipterygia]|nr:hypothetical protein C8R44DRAFT_979915 [Mycena epipterygia]
MPILPTTIDDKNLCCRIRAILTPTSMFFLDLPEDVIEYALCLSDISSVLSISQTNNYLHDLAFTPTIWRFLVEDLRKRNFVDRLSAADIRKMSTQTLVAVVRRLVVGPEAWSPPRIQSLQPTPFSKILAKFAKPQRQCAPPTQPSAHIILHPSISPGLPDPLWLDCKVLPGGRYLLFRPVNESQTLGCWRTAGDSLLSTYSSRIPSSYMVDFAAEALEGGERANIVIRLGNSLNFGYVEVISWDFVTGMTELLSVTQYTDRQLDPQTLPNICGGLVLVRTCRNSAWSQYFYEIIDWRAQQYCKILPPSSTESKFAMELVPGYFISTATSSSNKTQEIRICSIAALPNSWTPVGEHNTADPVLVSNVPHVVLTTIKLNGTPVRAGIIAVHRSPLQRGTYRVWLYFSYYEPRLFANSPDRALLCRFRLSLPETGDRQFTWRQQSCTPTEPALRFRGISYSGHTPKAHWSTGLFHRILPPDIPPAPIIVGTPERMEASWGNVAPYSGALTYFTDHSLVLCYFE